MIPKGLFVQIGLLLLSVAIIFTYIRPTFAGIGATQDDIAVYQQEADQISEVNSKLQTMVALVDSISIEDKDRLTTYIPNQIDTIMIPRDLEAISTQSGLLFNAVSYTGKSSKGQKVNDLGVATAQDANTPFGHSFSLNVSGSYQQLKSFFAALEENEYPLEVYSLTVAPAEGGFLTADMQLITYSHLDTDDNQPTP